MTDHFEAIESAEDEEALRRAYALALAEHGVRGDAAEYRRRFLERRGDLDARRGVAATPRDEVEAADRAFARWALRVASGEESAATLRAALDVQLPRFDERDRRRYSRLTAARDDWQSARADPDVDDALLRSFLARLTGAPASGAPRRSDKSVAVVKRRYTQLYEVDADWFESAAVSGASPVANFLRRYGIWIALAAIVRIAFKIAQLIEDAGP